MFALFEFDINFAGKAACLVHIKKKIFSQLPCHIFRVTYGDTGNRNNCCYNKLLCQISFSFWRLNICVVVGLIFFFVSEIWKFMLLINKSFLFFSNFSICTIFKHVPGIVSFCAGWRFVGSWVIWACWEAVPGSAALHHRFLSVGGELWAARRTPALVWPAWSHTITSQLQNAQP